MSRKIKLIWDFRGPEALPTAKHHAIHLQEFAVKESLTYHEVDVAELSDYFATAFIVVDEKDMLTYRDALKPHRGEVAN
ncbi:hypothetical protein EGM88_09500 [Aureibaculum marinum]|uniref:Uncharacterized protein n=1 Tax=Aureibaculum marinum TaxID=2487930 RepID=A0A3N4NK54_9FLAO|nr:hypothetical protein [Aureibaculum marinum]RPD96591.1 hypothetical protein EGM88_09500 [Aureibaculum marinum]